MKAALSLLFLTATLAAACSSGRTKADCDKIAEEIRKDATSQGLNADGICTNPAAPTFANACRELKECNEEAD